MNFPTNGLINYIDTQAKFCHLKILTCKGTLRQVFIRVYKLVIQPVMLVFSTQLCELPPLTSLVSSPLHHSLCEKLFRIRTASVAAIGGPGSPCTIELCQLRSNATQ
jgi:hypothetical protein